MNQRLAAMAAISINPGITGGLSQFSRRENGTVPFPNRTVISCSVLSGILLLAVAGCGGSTAVSGSVSYEGEPVENGSITFVPADGIGPSSGSTITGGRYRVDDMAPGEKIVQIVGLKAVPFAQTTAELAQQAEEAARRGQVAAPAADAMQIPDDAEGNNAKVQVKSGKQTLDFDLKRPSVR